MADPFEDVLDLEQNFFQEGYDQGLTDGHEAGLIEGKVFGIEKGFEKAVELGKLQGRGMFWEARITGSASQETGETKESPTSSPTISLYAAANQVGLLHKSARLQKHVDSLLATADGSALSTDNSDTAVADFEERIARSITRAKVISNIVGEPLEVSKSELTSIEDSQGLVARH